MKRTAKRIAIAYNLKKQANDDRYEEYDEIGTIEAIRDEIKKYSLKTSLIEQDDHFQDKILKTAPDIVFNITEGFGSTRGRESQVPCILESLGIPYSGSDPVSLGITMDKYLTNVVLSAHNVPVPKAFSAGDICEVGKLRNIFAQKKKFIVKPRWEGSSKGVFLDSVVTNMKELENRAARIIKQYGQPAIVEEFVAGDEITVGVYGNENPRVLGMMRISAKEERPDELFLYSIEIKREWEEKVKYEPESRIPCAVRENIEKNAIAAFKTLGLRDVSRIDFRVDKNGVPRIIDINPLPGLSPRYSDLPILCRLNGKSYEELVRTILKETFKRNGFAYGIFGKGA
ncbi:MAG TPA: ATP-grasp domain-containing protein [Candidatus Omnitrophota bacterium]|nr:ATP-grasp domain-containing protein [Candidatus Omnitrophota bacterium]HPS20649.1 ATP-grasp domain-containing protein [Candidatus Omnitrophota bacterium]